jgi:hypothetical protein
VTSCKEILLALCLILPVAGDGLLADETPHVVVVVGTHH